MSSQVFPSLPGLAFPVKRTPVWQSRVQTSVSGKRTRLTDWSFPRWKWELTYDFLLQGTSGGSTRTDFANLAGFFNARQGMFDPFLYTDADDNSASNQGLGIGDGSTVAFQLVRSFGGFVEPIYAPNAVSQVTLNGTPTSAYTLNSWGAPNPGTIVFNSAPGAGVTIAASFTFYFPVTFNEDSMDFEKFMAALYLAKKVTFESVK